ncbi:MAG: GAF domain-containing protein [Acidobacteria bacterium]|nr:GAF domain-containing protein [Acidobacteriota bacterium]
MTRTSVRVVLVLLLLVGVGVAAWQSYVLETRRLAGQRQEQSLDGLRTQVLHAIDDTRTAQQAYLAQGQGLDFWEAKFAEAMADLTQGLAAFRTQAAGQPAATEALDAADRALKVYEGVDRRIRSFVVNKAELMAADAVYEDGIKTAGVMRASVEQAHAALAGPLRMGGDERRLQYILAGAAAAAGILVSLLLLPTGRRDEPEVELHAPANSLHLHDRTTRVDPAPVDATDTIRPAVAAPGHKPHMTAGRGEPLLPTAADGRAGSPSPATTAAPRIDVHSEMPTPVPAAAEESTRRGGRPLADDALDATAKVCTDLARVKDADQLRDALGRAARLLDASGVIVWVTDGGGKALKPLLTYGYPEEALRRIPTLPRDQDNATAAAWRDAVTQVVDATETAPGAIAVPLIVPQGCVGVLAAEIRHGREADSATRALAQIVAAQLAVLLPTETV